MKQVTRYCAGILLLFASCHLPATTSPLLCKSAADPESYNNDFLDNFLTLKDGEAGWLFRDTDLLDSFGPGKKGMARLRYLAKLLRLRGTQLLVVPIPTRGISQPGQLGEIEYDYQSARQAYSDYLVELNRIGIIAPPLDRIFAGEQSEKLFFARDHHWTSTGARKVAAVVAETIKILPFYDSLARASFTTVSARQREMNGSHQKAAQQICSSAYHNEKYSTYSTHMQGNGLDELFADETATEVVLVGTSNSKSKNSFNFVGFLSEYSQLDILNQGQSGGGYDKAILDYLASREFQDSPPKLLIWEYPSYYKINSISFYKKMVRLLK